MFPTYFHRRSVSAARLTPANAPAAARMRDITVPIGTFRRSPFRRTSFFHVTQPTAAGTRPQIVSAAWRSRRSGARQDLPR
jgi:hypothetical protein